MRLPSRLGPQPLLLVLAATLAVAAPASAGEIRFEDARGDQAPFPDSYDLLAVTVADDGANLTFAMALAAAPVDQVSSVYEMVFESSTKRHNLGCFLGSSNPLAAAAPRCFGYYSMHGQPLGGTTPYGSLRFERDDANRTLRWTVGLRDLDEPAGESLRLIRAYAQMGVSEDGAVGDVSLGQPQDVAATDQEFPMPAMAPAPRGIRSPEEPSSPAPAEDAKKAPGPAAAFLGVATLGLAAALRRRS